MITDAHSLLGLQGSSSFEGLTISDKGPGGFRVYDSRFLHTTRDLGGGVWGYQVERFKVLLFATKSTNCVLNDFWGV